MKKIWAILFLMLTAGWAVYLYGNIRDADANLALDTHYQPDAKLPDLVGNLQVLSARMRNELDRIEHDEKKQAAEPAEPVSPRTLRDPFSSGFLSQACH